MKDSEFFSYTPARIFVSGHRNPDIDSLASACALAWLRSRQGMPGVSAICPGIMSERAHYLFSRFGLPEPEVRTDLYVRISDIMTASPATITAGTTLWEGFRALRRTGYQRLPVTDGDGHYLGMLSPMCVLNKFLNLSSDGDSILAGREIDTSIDLIRQVLNAESITSFRSSERQRFMVYVAAMQADSFEAHLPPERNSDLAIIVGDRPDIHLRVLQRRIRLLIVTGSNPVDPAVVEQARRQEVTILRCSEDSAAVIRRMPFAVPVENAGLRGRSLILSPDDKLRDVATRVGSHFEDVVPVVDAAGLLCGLVLKSLIAQPPPFHVILVDHNEIEQSLPGVEGIPVIEIVDHHRIRTLPTDQPIRFTSDTVGSTCTIVARMCKQAGMIPDAPLSGLLLAGIITDTLNLKSPTTTLEDRETAAWLQQLSGTTGEQLMQELSDIASPLASEECSDALNADRKNYHEGSIHFALAQIEETNLELLDQKQEQLRLAMEKIRSDEMLAFIGLLVTDPVRANSRLLLCGKSKFAAALPYRQLADGIYDLPGVLSRKKQLLPQILSAVRSSQEA